MQRLRTYASFVRFSHSVFALPFALTGALLALHRLDDWHAGTVAWRILWIVVAMVAARSAAMGFNRLVDAYYDALNPRTAMRELPRGAMTRPEAVVFVTVASIVFVFAAWKLSPLCFALSPVALAIVALLLLARSTASARMRTIAQLLAIAVMLVFPAVMIGFYEGGYNHAVKNAVYFFVGEDTTRSMFPGDMYEMPSDFLFEATGIAQLPLGWLTALLCVRSLQARSGR